MVCLPNVWVKVNLSYEGHFRVSGVVGMANGIKHFIKSYTDFRDLVTIVMCTKKATNIVSSKSCIQNVCTL